MAADERAAGAGTEEALEAAAKRLERAVAMLETRLDQVRKDAQTSAGSLFDFDRSKLADELDAARSRESALEDAGREASEALGRAITEIRGALRQAEAS